MNRVLVITAFLLRDLFRSLGGVVPPILTLGVYQATFYFSGKIDYFASVGAVDMMFVGLITTLILASRANRAATYPILARLSCRAELLAGIGMAALAIMLAMSVLFGALIVILNGMALSLADILLIAPRWLALFIFTIVLGLNMSKLASRWGSYLLVTAALAFMVTVSEQQVFLVRGEARWLVSAVAFAVSPVTALVTIPASAAEPSASVLPMLFTYLYSLALACLAVLMFARKDLLWIE